MTAQSGPWRARRHPPRPRRQGRRGAVRTHSLRARGVSSRPEEAEPRERSRVLRTVRSGARSDGPPARSGRSGTSLEGPKKPPQSGGGEGLALVAKSDDQAVEEKRSSVDDENPSHTDVHDQNPGDRGTDRSGEVNVNGAQFCRSGDLVTWDQFGNK